MAAPREATSVVKKCKKCGEVLTKPCSDCSNMLCKKGKRCTHEVWMNVVPSRANRLAYVYLATSGERVSNTPGLS